MSLSRGTIPQFSIHMSTMPRRNCKKRKLVFMKLWKMTVGSGRIHHACSRWCCCHQSLNTIQCNVYHESYLWLSEIFGLKHQRVSLCPWELPLMAALMVFLMIWCSAVIIKNETWKFKFSLLMISHVRRWILLQRNYFWSIEQ